ncbi:PilZ domain-containing protein [Paenibacillus turicensis]|uniref:PilZ domain-containing protein n=1 Tax=Paenibacillus turicensis TaxID=160487 RepID=UPI003D2D19A4
MTTKRKVPFRYSMTPPVPCKLQIIGINGAAVSSKPADVSMIDINKAGCRIHSSLDLKANLYQILVNIHIGFNDTPYIFEGEIKWQKALDDQVLSYGIEFLISEELQEKFQIELRKLAAERKIVVL